MSHRCRRLPLLALAAGLLAPSAASAAAIPESFYTPAASLPPKHGLMIQSMAISGGALPKAGKSFAVLYSSQARNGDIVPVSGVVTIPKGKAPKGGFPVVSWAHRTTGIADSCAPSKIVTSPPSSTYVKNFQAETTHWVKEGYVVAQTDYQGLGTAGMHPYVIGVSEGRSVIDIVSAARGLDRRVGKTWAAIGHSQGGHAALWAAALAKSYAPGLKLKGAAPLAPGSHFGEQSAVLDTLDSNPLGGLPALIIAAILDDQGIAPETVFSDAAMALYPQIEQVCLDKLSQPDSFGGLGLKAHIRDGVDIAPLAAALSANDPEDLTVPVPLLIAQGKDDSTVFPTLTDQLVADYRSRKMKVTYRTYAGVDHNDVVQASRKDADRFLDKVLG